MAKYQLDLEPLCEIEVYVTAPFPVGPSSWGTRLVFPVEGGTFTGPKFKGKIHPFGADWAVIRADNCFEVDVRLVLETDDGAFVHVYYTGVIDMTKEQADKFMTGEISPGLNIYTTPRFETSHEKYRWLNRIQAVARGGVEKEGDKVKVTYTWFILK